MTTSSTINPLLHDWFNDIGLPDFSTLKPYHFPFALDQAELTYSKELEAIATNEETPTFENTIRALDIAGRHYKDITSLFYILSVVDSTQNMQEIEVELAPRIASFQATLFQNPLVFDRIEHLKRNQSANHYSIEESRLIDRFHIDFIKAGARISEENKQAYSDLLAKIAEAHSLFSQHVAADEDEYVLQLDAAQVDSSLPDSLLNAARENATSRGYAPGSLAVSLTPTFFEPFISFCSNRGLREQLWKARENRGRRGNGNDNREIIRNLITWSHQVAQLQGYSSFAAYQLADSMAGSPDAVMKVLQKVWPMALQALEIDRKALIALATELKEATPLQAWDWLYYAEKLRQRDFALDDREVKPYFTLDAMLQACFACAGRLFGLRFVDVSSEYLLHHPDAKIWRVDIAGGELVGHLVTDLLARPTKLATAWMSAFRYQQPQVTPTIIISCSFAAVMPALLGYQDSKALFHEFGHALHGLLSNVNFERLSGTQVPRDFAEFPSQFFENFLENDLVVTEYARHVSTGETLPSELRQKIIRASKFDQAWGTTQSIARSIIDLAVHTETPQDNFNADEFELRMRQKLAVPTDVGPAYYLPNFVHLFSYGGYYAAGYYVYLWSEIIEADVFAKFSETGNIFDPTLAAKLHHGLLAKGNAIDPGVALHNLINREPNIQPFLIKNGLIKSY